MSSTLATNTPRRDASTPVPSNTYRPAPRVAGPLDALAALLARYSITALRISLGLVFLGFGALKFFDGMSPAAELAQRTIDALTFGIVGPDAALLITAILETVIGLTLITGIFLRAGLVLLAGAFVGIMAPLVLFFHELFPHGPTIVGQYVIKDIVLVCAAAVVASHALGARLTLPGARS
ncbi:DoxX family protein [Cellulomonas edaphi]|uniref:DoxX family protein n=1 Tax=Cellulomonas edaphi TaxID=3053468 RepID=A0ABT7S8C5_9CELL|nr:DoxX family protein [Cellulomons edaphi]MDM7831846.1 DoxX family protein [Cellulomons edaphi]